MLNRDTYSYPNFDRALEIIWRIAHDVYNEAELADVIEDSRKFLREMNKENK